MTYKIRVGDFKIGDEERKAINEVLDSGRISEGKKVREFEEKWAEYIGTKYCVAVNSGTSALMNALFTLKELYKLSGKVKTHKITFVATHNAIRVCGFEPIYEDDEEETQISVPVHLMGYPQFIESKFIIEDTSQAHGTVYKGKKLGSFGIMGTFSFYIAHNIQAGEMGAVVTDDILCYKMLKRIKAHGRLCDCPVCVRSEGKCPRSLEYDPRFTHDIFGLNFKTMEFPAALALVQLKRADEIKAKRQFNVQYLNKGLEDFQDVIDLPEFSTDISYLAYPLYSDFREIIRRELEKNGIESRPLFNHHYGFYIGCHQYLTKEDLDYVLQVLRRILHALPKG
jgi:perosamine synthetase